EGSTPGNVKEKVYSLSKLAGNTTFSATLTWDRIVQLVKDPAHNDPMMKNTYQDDSKGKDTFKADPLGNLDLYLVKKGQWPKHEYGSISTVDNIEHIFYRIRDTAEYELHVVQRSDVKQPTNYGLAWWGVRPDPDKQGALPGGPTEGSSVT